MAPPKGKAAVASLAVAVIVGWGVYLGASIKTDKELTEIKQEMQIESPEQRIIRLTKAREALVHTKNDLEAKIREKYQ
ncbi:hypothetical protein BJ508DRAFT_410008 [Ascobolus immersus RN42]|uniref:Uncharacterized protein n=1 Tax=Ascobolus immersus RN42 TaxID=1160509 RepID=A0A3N4IV68_ASCIM|nr:hypothetical protein BJ508DRAFT_410008 [Ascobolus immersus RN42]